MKACLALLLPVIAWRWSGLLIGLGTLSTSLRAADLAGTPGVGDSASLLAYAPTPPDNPLKGLVPYAGQGDGFPCSLEFNYLALRDLMIGPTNFHWAPLERLLDDISSRGRQAVFRIWMEYPGRPSGIPHFLIEGGLRTVTYTNTNTQPLPPKLVATPDYEDPRLRSALTSFIGALGARYDGDPRIGFITAGLLGTWGEWHTHPRSDLWASRTVQREVLDAYESAFRLTPVLLRYPAGPDHPVHTDNATRAFGYHDDSFAFATRHTGRPEDSWFFESLLRAAGPGALGKWRTHPIGGEIRPEVWTCVWDQPPCTPSGQDFGACVEATHVSWLMDSGTFRRGAFGRVLTGAMRKRAATWVRRMGYEVQVTAARLGPTRGAGTLELSLTLTNHGVAPFYQPWPVELAARSTQGTLKVWSTAVDLRQTHPESILSWQLAMDSRGLATGPHRLLLRVRNPLENGRPFRFANAGQDADLPGWLTLGTVEIP